MDQQRPHRTDRPGPSNQFHYPQAARTPRRRDDQRSAHDEFPPHPSVRIPLNVRAGTRQHPASAGVAQRPSRDVASAGRLPMQQQGQQYAGPRAQNNGRAPQNYRFPTAPPPIPPTVKSQRSRELQGASAGRYNMHDSYVSSIGDESTARTTPSSKSPHIAHSAQARDSASVYADTEGPESPQTAYPSSKIIPTDTFPTPSQGSRELDSHNSRQRPTPRIDTTSMDAQARPPRLGDISPASSRTTAMNALSAAIAAGFSSGPVRTPVQSPPPSRTFSPVRMPFGQEEETESPEASQEELAPPQLKTPTPNNKGQKSPSSLRSMQSSEALLGLGIKQPNGGFSDKRGVVKRPPKLDIDAVRDMEARGSTTSLTELIRRATRLAGNLDRGKTASRLGMLDMLGEDEKLGGRPRARRESTMSDMISAFPAPAAGGTPRRDTMWPEKGDYGQNDGTNGGRDSRRRRCCGMSMPVFIAVFVIVIVLIAAAVLIPVFLVLVPKQHSNSGPNLQQCATSYPCDNEGTSIVSNDACNCVCSNGFTGAHCDIAPSSDCTSRSVVDASRTYRNATMGTDLVPVFEDAGPQFNIVLNGSTILSLFASGDLSCSSENTIIDFNSTSASEKRFVIVPGLGAANINPNPLPVPTATFTTTRNLVPRQTASTDGIVFATSSGAPQPTAASTTTVLSGSTPSTTSPPASASSSTGIGTDTTPKQLEFAQLVVLYALQQSGTISIAANAKQQLLASLLSGNTTEKVQVGFGSFVMVADFKDFSIKQGDVTVGGTA